MITIVLALVIMIVLDGLLILLTTEYRMVSRTSSYGSALYVAEAGAEEGVAMLNYGASNWSANGWSSSGATYVKTMASFTSLNNASSVGTYTVVLSNLTSSNPVAVCTGTVSTVGTTVSGANNTNVTRVVSVIMKPRPTFQWALLAQNAIDLSGNNMSTDSFDSTNPNYSAWTTNGYGVYNSSKNKDNGDVATNDTITNSISVGNANILGHAYTGPGGTITVGSQGYVGSLASHPVGTIDTNRVGHSMDASLSTYGAPFTSGQQVVNGTMTGGGSSFVDYTASSVSGSLTLLSGNARLYVSGDIDISGNGQGIFVAPGAYLEIYAAGEVTIDGKGGFNSGGQASQLQVYVIGGGDVRITGNAQFTGVLYAPQSFVHLGGGGATGYVIGSLVGGRFRLDGHMDMHYDEALKNRGPTRGYSVVAWQEL